MSDKNSDQPPEDSPKPSPKKVSKKPRKKYAKQQDKKTPRKIRKRPSREPKGDYPVGYARPPKDKQFKKGISGNLNGRPRKNKPEQEIDVKATSNSQPSHQEIDPPSNPYPTHQNKINSGVVPQVAVVYDHKPMPHRIDHRAIQASRQDDDPDEFNIDIDESDTSIPFQSPKSYYEKEQVSIERDFQELAQQRPTRMVIRPRTVSPPVDTYMPNDFKPYVPKEPTVEMTAEECDRYLREAIEERTDAIIKYMEANGGLAFVLRPRVILAAQNTPQPSRQAIKMPTRHMTISQVNSQIDSAAIERVMERIQKKRFGS